MTKIKGPSRGRLSIRARTVRASVSAFYDREAERERVADLNDSEGPVAPDTEGS
jgi:hypothetical protein